MTEMNSNSQEELYNKLKVYETKRRLSYANKLDSIALYWKSYCDLLSASLKETERAQRIVIGTSNAYSLYAENMRGIYEDTFLDEKGNIAKEKNSRQRKPRQFATAKFPKAGINQR